VLVVVVVVVVVAAAAAAAYFVIDLVRKFLVTLSYIPYLFKVFIHIGLYLFPYT